MNFQNFRYVKTICTWFYSTKIFLKGSAKDLLAAPGAPAERDQSV